jgi:hypothetical protein
MKMFGTREIMEVDYGMAETGRDRKTGRENERERETACSGI